AFPDVGPHHDTDILEVIHTLTCPPIFGVTSVLGVLTQKQLHDRCVSVQCIGLVLVVDSNDLADSLFMGTHCNLQLLADEVANGSTASPTATERRFVYPDA